MKNIVKALWKRDYRHNICIVITILFCILGVLRFQSSFGRLIEAMRDFGLSFVYYFLEILEVEHGIIPTVTLDSAQSMQPFFLFPFTWEEFQTKWQAYWQVWYTVENLSAYGDWVSRFLLIVSRVLLIAFPFALLFYLLFIGALRSENNDYNKDTKHLIRFKRFVDKVINPVKRWILAFYAFMRKNSYYWKIWLVLWGLYFNIFTIVIEFLAFYLYFIISFDFITIYKQVYKLFVDLSTLITFIPVPVWIIIAYLVLCYVRRKIGYSRLNHLEMKNRGFINSLPIVSLLVGLMGSKKTTTKTDMELSTEAMFRDKAYEMILENDMKFPYFPWINFERAIKSGMKKHTIYNLATCKKYVRKQWRKFKRKNNYYLYEYDYKRYGLTYDDKLKVVDLGEVLETYAQLYFIYIITSSLIIGNLSVRTDNMINSRGNFPLWDTDFFKRDSRDLDKISHHSHILDFDSLRLGKKVIENNKLSNSFEFGVLSITEIGKERKNMLDLKSVKKDEDGANQRNDGFNDYLKMIRHSATVDKYPFVRLFADEQRPESWGADARDLCYIVHCLGSDDKRLAMPFFGVTDTICNFILGRFERFYSEYRFNRGDNCLTSYLYKKLASRLKHYQTNIWNTFGYTPLNVGLEAGTQDGDIEMHKYYLCDKKIYAARFATDAMGDFFYERALKSGYGLNDIAEYTGEKASFKEFAQQNSYLMNDWIKNEKSDKPKDKKEK